MKRTLAIVLAGLFISPWGSAACAVTVVGRTVVFNINGQRTTYSGAEYDKMSEEQKAHYLMDMIETAHRAEAECDGEIPVYGA